MSLAFYYHPLASFCHKVLIALYENGTPFQPVFVDFSDEASSAAVLAHWPVGKIPVLRDEARGQTVPETSIMIEYLEQHYPGPLPLLPRDLSVSLDVRLWDRFFDLYVSVPMQKIVGDRLRPEAERDAFGVAEARASLEKAYALAERQLTGREWIAGSDFSMADCSAAPALFYTSILQPFGATHPSLAAYFERLLARPSFARTLREARPYFQYFPMYADMPARFLEGAG